MSTKKEMDIEYNNIKTKLSIPDKFSEFKELCIKTFYISELRSQKMEFFYIDEDNEYVMLDEGSYEEEDAKKAKFWKLSIKGESTGPKKKNENSSKNILAQKKALLDEAKLYKEKLFEKCNSILEEKIKEKNEQHKNNIQKIKDEFSKNLKDFKNSLDKQTKEYLGKISENALNIYMEKSKLIGKDVIDNMTKNLGEFKDDDELNIGEIGTNINDTNANVKDCKDLFQNIVKESQHLKFIIDNVVITNNLNELKSITFKLKIRKFSEAPIENSFIRILSKEDNKYEDIKIDLNDLDKDAKEKEITFNPQISKNKNYLFVMALLNKNNNNEFNIISNPSKLTINVVEIGSNNDLFE